MGGNRRHDATGMTTKDRTQSGRSLQTGRGGVGTADRMQRGQRTDSGGPQVHRGNPIGGTAAKPAGMDALAAGGVGCFRQCTRPPFILYIAY